MPPLDLERLEGRPEAITEIHSHSAINAMDDYRPQCNQSDERRAKLEQEMCCNNAIMQGPPGGKQTSRSHCCFVIVGVVAQLSVLSGGDQADHHHATWDSHTLAGALCKSVMALHNGAPSIGVWFSTSLVWNTGTVQMKAISLFVFFLCLCLCL